MARKEKELEVVEEVVAVESHVTVNLEVDPNDPRVVRNVVDEGVVVETFPEPEYPKGTVITHLDKDPNDPRRPRVEEEVTEE